MSAGFIYSQQLMLFGRREIIGYSKEHCRILEIGRDVANEIIIRNHYSHKVYAASTIHLGYFEGDVLKGIVQLGYAMNPTSQDSVVRGTKLNEYLELNRLWIDDDSIIYAESQCISMVVKYIRGKYPAVKWIQSFADERCGKFGGVYQACSFDYYGEHTTAFYELDGVVYHKSLAERNPELSPAAKYLQENIGRATRNEYRQFRYIKFIDARMRKYCRHTKKPYPKPTSEARAEVKRVSGRTAGLILNPATSNHG